LFISREAVSSNPIKIHSISKTTKSFGDDVVDAQIY